MDAPDADFSSGPVAIHTRILILPTWRRVTAEFGNYDLRHYTAAVNVPIVSDTLGTSSRSL